MLHILIDLRLPIDKVICFETEWDFPQMDKHLKIVEKKDWHTDCPYPLLPSF